MTHFYFLLSVNLDVFLKIIFFLQLHHDGELPALVSSVCCDKALQTGRLTPGMGSLYSGCWEFEACSLAGRCAFPELVSLSRFYLINHRIWVLSGSLIFIPLPLESPLTANTITSEILDVTATANEQDRVGARGERDSI